ncbi:flagellar motor protein MotB [Aliamphritea spongicola]|uniref:flagellar motor protein MotB n=1 Tax=Aliamphritea spongicola TaxID=707589 RepID=UPI00196B5D7A|nr:flagellar motor protein MotB [Aliamphritea spongicola]MBN3563537.1 flagellar motor protein MotD [Aliamphritea spongicola]
MPRRRVEDDSSHTDRWIISYADFITILFAFFVVMYAISSVNEEKYKEISSALSGVFAGFQTDQFEGPANQEAQADSIGIGIFDGGESDDNSPTVKIVPPKPENSVILGEIADKTQLQFKKLIRDGHLKVQSNNLWVAIELGANLVFPEGGALPPISIDPLFAEVAEILKEYPNPIHVEGFTDDQYISTDEFPSNWELSAARAASIVRILELNGVEPHRMAAVGFGEYQPVRDNGTEDGRRINRRAVIVVSRDRKTQRVVAAFGSQQVSEDAVSSVLVEDRATPADMERVETEDGKVIFRRKVPRNELEVDRLTQPITTPVETEQ